MRQDPIKQAIRGVHRAWFEDGVWEIGFGAALLVLTAFNGLSLWLDWPNRLGNWTMLLQVVVVVAAMLSVRWLTALLKQRFTFPRTGYLSFRRPAGRERWRRAILAFGLSMLLGGIGGAVRLAGQPVNRMPLIYGLILGGGLIVMCFVYGLMRFLALGLLTLALGFAVALLDLPIDLGVITFMGGIALMLLLDGVIALVRLIRKYPVDAGEDTSMEGE